MNTSPTKSASKSWLKLAIIPVLVGVLGYVVWSNQGSKPADSAEAAPVPLPNPISDVLVAPRKNEPLPVTEVQKVKRVAWPKFTTDQILATNPFRGSAEMRTALKPVDEQPAIAAAVNMQDDPKETPEEEVDPWAGLADSFTGKTSTVFLNSSKGPVLRVGSKMLKVGDRIGDRYRVTEVRPDGIVVEAAPATK